MSLPSGFPGLGEPHSLEILLDLEQVKVLTVKPPTGGAPAADGYGSVTHANVDRHLIARVRVTAGRREVGVTFLNKVGVGLDAFADSQGELDELFEPLDV